MQEYLQFREELNAIGENEIYETRSQQKSLRDISKDLSQRTSSYSLSDIKREYNGYYHFLGAELAQKMFKSPKELHSYIEEHKPKRHQPANQPMTTPQHKLGEIILTKLVPRNIELYRAISITKNNIRAKIEGEYNTASSGRIIKQGLLELIENTIKALKERIVGINTIIREVKNTIRDAFLHNLYDLPEKRIKAIRISKSNAIMGLCVSRHLSPQTVEKAKEKINKMILEFEREIHNTE